jgi:precorrin-6B methylase 2
VILWDAFCHYGSFAIQAAAQEEVFYVAAFNRSKERLRSSAFNASQIYKKDIEIDYILGSFEKLRIKCQEPDAIFIHLESTVRENEEFNLCKHITPPIGEVIIQAARQCKNQIYVLPK